MGRTKQTALPVEVEATRAKFMAWRQTRKSGVALPEELWSEAAGLARRLGVGRVCRALGLNHTTLKKHVLGGQVATSPVQRPRHRPEPPAFVELDGSHVLGDFPGGPVLELTRPEGQCMVLRWRVVDPCGLMATFLERGQ